LHLRLHRVPECSHRSLLVKKPFHKKAGMKEKAATKAPPRSGLVQHPVKRRRSISPAPSASTGCSAPGSQYDKRPHNHAAEEKAHDGGFLSDCPSRGGISAEGF